ncbi:MAG: phosphate acetyltransferase, partial [Propionibacteriaceae bacterium]|nr:phosphate acetyltransferase [Propionibacteriaceae bacterium]
MSNDDLAAKAAAFANDIAARLGPWLQQVGSSAQTGAATTAEIGKQLGAACTGEFADPDALIAALKRHNSAMAVRKSFTRRLEALAKGARKRIVLPEAEDDRVLKAAAILAAKDVVDVTLLGDPEAVADRAAELGIDLGATAIESPDSADKLEAYAAEYAKLRAHKGVTIEQAREKMRDLSYYATMMVQLGEADGMVSGACHTTANTIRPAFEFVRTKPGVSVVSGAFLLCLADQVAVYADCAVNPNPTAEQLADIALTAAETAVAFGLTPKVAMLSYSTGDSGKGPDVDRMAEAVKLAQAKSPGLALDGPLQYDAAVDKDVAKLKRPDSLVAGQASVFVFPDLEAGNIGYKIAQRTSGALVIGPLLQGLNKPVNDLSRGSLVDDIVNTVIITAIQSQTNTPAGE